MAVKLEWATVGGDDLIARMARVSNPANQDNKETAPRLVKYMIDHAHWSPFEMVSMCVEIETTRDIGRQILRHRSFSFQEFSQRYAEVAEFQRSGARLQDSKNRQSSIIVPHDDMLNIWWRQRQQDVISLTSSLYQEALDRGIAKEVARKVLPEGLTTTRMYMTGNVRSWIHYLGLRTDEATQLEHRVVAEEIHEIFCEQFPQVAEALGW